EPISLANKRCARWSKRVFGLAKFLARPRHKQQESRRVKEYDLYIPLAYNDGTPIESRKLVRLRNRLLKQFGGLTFFPQSNEGFWTVAGVTYRDRIVIYRVITGDVRFARR